jgi:type II secretory pathway pseudopilin PulG
MRPSLRTQAGFGYFSVILAIAVLGVALAGIGELWSTQAQREREAELLRAGSEIRRAIISYSAATRAGTPSYPMSLDDLLEDRRGPQVRRHLRKIYADPMTRSTEWGLVKLQDGRIRGVFSRSQQPPIKTAGFPFGLEHFEKAETYRDWQFAHQPRTAPVGPSRQ